MLEIFTIHCITFTKMNYNKKINSSDTEHRTKLDYKNVRVTDDYEYPTEEEEKTITDLNAFKNGLLRKKQR